MGKGKKEYIMEFNVTKKELFNGKNNAQKAEDYLDQELIIKGMFTYEDDVLNKETGEVSQATLVCIVTTDGTLISSPSKTLVDSATKLYESFDNETEGLAVMITANKSNNGRTFYRLEVL